MRNILLIIFLLVTGLSEVTAQRGLPRQKAVQLTGGPVDGFLLRDGAGRWSYHGALALTRHNRNHSHWLYGLSYLQTDYLHAGELIPKAQFIGQWGYYAPLVADRRHNVVLYLGPSVPLGYETSNWGVKLLEDGSTLRNTDSFVWGAALGVQLDVYLSDRCVVVGSLHQRAL